MCSREAKGSDIFDFDAIEESTPGSSRDQIIDFEDGIDRIDLSTIDAVIGSRFNVINDAFIFIGGSGLLGRGRATPLRPDLRTHYIYGDVNGDSGQRISRSRSPTAHRAWRGGLHSVAAIKLNAKVAISISNLTLL